MLTSSRIVTFALLGLAATLWGTHIRALEGAGRSVAADKTPMRAYQTPRAALQAGLEDFRLGNPSSALAALEYAASGGEALAQWKLAKIYATGDGVPRDDVKAYDYFSQIVSGYDEDNPNQRDLPLVASAFVSVGVYRLNGIAGSDVRADAARARQMFQIAATNFGDANAQYNLARMLLDGAGVQKDTRRGLQWLDLAAKKGHIQAEALLGKILLTGVDGIPAQKPLALMWLTLAREAASDSKKDQAIVDLYEKAMTNANDEDRQAALVYLEDHLKRQY
ncbi:tetratricopeptide repeat protein [Methylocapsa acidiphila]|uniref:tetratricopeptide repeat protein n=1 Tax=Methylocapsa acidiphila TaxID=133552 RepID=UPI000684DA5D|nr:tetratricopeptide repeat protein [Methylocapsa acidiphila]